MKKTRILFDLLFYVNEKRRFTAKDVAQEFGISVRTAHRYLLELEEMGVPLYTEPGRYGGYRVLPERTLPPVFLNENEVLSIFFAFQSLKFYQSLPFEIDIESASRKLFSGLPADRKEQIRQVDSRLIFWNRKRDAETPLLKDLIEHTIQKSIIEIVYSMTKGTTSRKIAPLGLYSYDGFWYVPAYDYKKREIRQFRADRILDIEDTVELHDLKFNLYDWLHSYKLTNPVHLYVELTDEGVRQSRNNPFMETEIRENQEGNGGFIDTTIDYADIEFTGKFFLQLGTHAKVIEPAEMKKYICREAENILKLYNQK